MDSYNPKEFEVVSYSTAFEKDEEKNSELKKLHEKDIENLKKQLLYNPKDVKASKYLKRGYSDKLIQ